jgi:hypothetical protein
LLQVRGNAVTMPAAASDAAEVTQLKESLQGAEARTAELSAALAAAAATEVALKKQLAAAETAREQAQARASASAAETATATALQVAVERATAAACEATAREAAAEARVKDLQAEVARLQAAAEARVKDLQAEVARLQAAAATAAAEAAEATAAVSAVTPIKLSAKPVFASAEPVLADVAAATEAAEAAAQREAALRRAAELRVAVLEREAAEWLQQTESARRLLAAARDAAHSAQMSAAAARAAQTNNANNVGRQPGGLIHGFDNPATAGLAEGAEQEEEEGESLEVENARYALKDAVSQLEEGEMFKQQLTTEMAAAQTSLTDASEQLSRRERFYEELREDVKQMETELLSTDADGPNASAHEKLSNRLSLALNRLASEKKAVEGLRTSRAHWEEEVQAMHEEAGMFESGLAEATATRDAAAAALAAATDRQAEAKALRAAARKRARTATADSSGSGGAAAVAASAASVEAVESIARQLAAAEAALAAAATSIHAPPSTSASAPPPPPPSSPFSKQSPPRVPAEGGDERLLAQNAELRAQLARAKTVLARTPLVRSAASAVEGAVDAPDLAAIVSKQLARIATLEAERVEMLGELEEVRETLLHGDGDGRFPVVPAPPPLLTCAVSPTKRSGDSEAARATAHEEENPFSPTRRLAAAQDDPDLSDVRVAILQTRMQLARAKELAQEMSGGGLALRTSYCSDRGVGVGSSYVRGDAMRALRELRVVGRGVAVEGTLAAAAAGDDAVVTLQSSLSAAHAEANELRVATRRLEAELGMIAQAADEVVLLEQALEMMQTEKEEHRGECERMAARLETVLAEMERMEEQLAARSVATDSVAGSAPSTPRRV